MNTSSWYKRTPQEKETVWEIISWWEIRRIPFNVIAVIAVLLVMNFFDWLYDAKGLGSPLIFIPLMILGIIGINLTYMFFYLVDIFLRNQENAPIYPLRSSLFLISLFTPCILYFNFVLYAIISH